MKLNTCYKKTAYLFALALLLIFIFAATASAEGGGTLYFRHTDGRFEYLQSDGSQVYGAGSISSRGNSLGLNPEWESKAAADMNGNGRFELIIQNKYDGRLVVGYLNASGNDIERYEKIYNPSGGDRISTDWELRDVYDLNNNGNPDLIWQGVSGNVRGQLAIWFMDGLTATSPGRITQAGGRATIDPSWQLRAVGDLMGNGRPELLWQAVSGAHRGELAYWTLSGFERSGGGRLTHQGGRASINPAWQMRALGDLTGNGNPEIIWHNSNGSLAYWEMSGNNRNGGGSLAPGSKSASWTLFGMKPADGTTTPPPTDFAQVEQNILYLVNDIRATWGRQPLQMHDQTRELARAHSRDMANNNFFSHTSPTTGSFADRFNNAGISYSAAAENIHKNTVGDARTAFNGWYNSPGHRQNMLSRDYTHTGIGIAERNGTYYYTQKFFTPR